MNRPGAVIVLNVSLPDNDLALVTLGDTFTDIFTASACVITGCLIVAAGDPGNEVLVLIKACLTPVAFGRVLLNVREPISRLKILTSVWHD